MADFINTFPIEKIYRFGKPYQSREDYRARTGREAPPFDPTKDFKSWEDTMPVPATPGGRFAIYDVLAMEGNKPIQNPDGSVMRDSVLIRLEDAARVNIPIKDVQHIPDQIGTGHETPVPIRPLLPGESLVFSGITGAVEVKVERADPIGGMSDRALLEAIARKVGVGQ